METIDDVMICNIRHKLGSDHRRQEFNTAHQQQLALVQYYLALNKYIGTWF